MAITIVYYCVEDGEEFTFKEGDNSRDPAVDIASHLEVHPTHTIRMKIVWR